MEAFAPPLNVSCPGFIFERTNAHGESEGWALWVGGKQAISQKITFSVDLTWGSQAYSLAGLSIAVGLR